MQPRFKISCDSSCDCLTPFFKEQDISVIAMSYIVNGEPTARVYDTEADFDAFYAQLQAGMQPTTSQLNAYEFMEYFEKLLENASCDIVHMCLSSGLSGQFTECESAGRVINSKGYKHKLHIFDALTATQGEAHLLEKLIALRDNGVPAEDAFAELSAVRDGLQHFVIVNDLFHLKRGGRISGVKAAIGSMFKIKPVITFNDKGHLAIFGKEKGTKNAVDFLVHSVAKYGAKCPSVIRIVHSGADPLVLNSLETALKEKYDCPVVRGKIGPVIASHLGTGAFALIFDGKKRLTIS